MAKITYKFFVENILNNPKYDRKQVYWAYQQTERWFELREARLVLDNHRCRMCDAPATCVHHRRYPEVFGKETVDDLTSLCHQCHENFHHPPGVDEIRKQLMKAKDDKMAVCPCCDRKVKLYKRPLNSSMAYGLILLRKFFKDNPDVEWIHAESYFKSRKDAPSSLRGDFAKLRYWDLVELQSGASSDARQGNYKILQKGIDFVEGRISVPRRVHLYNKSVVGFDEDETNINSALGDKFDYKELMRE